MVIGLVAHWCDPAWFFNLHGPSDWLVMDAACLHDGMTSSVGCGVVVSDGLGLLQVV